MMNWWCESQHDPPHHRHSKVLRLWRWFHHAVKESMRSTQSFWMIWRSHIIHGTWYIYLYECLIFMALSCILWYIYLHDFSDFYGFHVCKYTSPIDAFLDCFSSIFSEKRTWMAWGPDHWKTWPCPTQLSLDGLSPGIICLNLAANQDESQIPNLTTGPGSLKNAFGPVSWERKHVFFGIYGHIFVVGCWNYGSYVGGLCLYLLRGCNTWSEGLRRPPGRSTWGWTNKNWHDSKKQLKTETGGLFFVFFDLKHEKHFCIFLLWTFFLGGGAGGGLMGNGGTSHGTNSRPASEVIHLSSGQYVALRAGHVGGIQSFLASNGPLAH